MPDHDTPADLAPEARTASGEATDEEFLRLFLAQRERMEALVSRRVGCRATAADLIQDLFLRFWKRPRRELDEPVTYLLRSARNLAIDHLRGEDARNRSLDGLAAEPAAEAASPEAALQAGDALQRIEAALHDLPPRTRHIFLLNRIHGRTYGEIARAMELSQSAVEKHMMRALEACKASLAPPAQAGPTSPGKNRQ